VQSTSDDDTSLGQADPLVQRKTELRPIRRSRDLLLKEQPTFSLNQLHFNLEVHFLRIINADAVCIQVYETGQ